MIINRKHIKLIIKNKNSLRNIKIIMKMDNKDRRINKNIAIKRVMFKIVSITSKTKTNNMFN